MTKAAIMILAGTDTHADLGRVTNALHVAAEFDEAGDDVVVIFDGAGTQWIPELEDEDHSLNAVYRSQLANVQVCDYCADAFHVSEEVDGSDAPRTADFRGHPSVRSLVEDGYEVITF